MENLFFWLEILLLILIGSQVLYLFTFSVAGLFPVRNKVGNSDSENKKFAVLIPGYKEDAIIKNTAKQALNQNYPKDLYRVVILADSFGDETLAELRKLDVEVLEVDFENSTKAKSLNKGLEYLSDDPPDLVAILDSDNIMERDFLSLMNQKCSNGQEIVQGHRTAKNQDTPIALLDAINEEIGNNIFRKGHRNLGLSSALIGSAMVFPFEYFKSIMADIKDVAGEDKLIEFKVLREGHTIDYLHQAVVYDEKVSKGKNFSKQRTRWVGAQVYFFKKFIGQGFLQLFKGNIDFFVKALQMGLIPKVLLIGLTVLAAILALFGLLSTYWIYLFLLYTVGLFLAIPKRFYNSDLLTAIIYVPKALFFMIIGILRIRKKTATHFEVTEKKR